MHDLLGLSPADAALHRAVLRHPGLGASAYAATTGQDVRAARRRLALLAEHGLLTKTGSAYAAVRPDVALADVLAAEQDEVERRERRLDEARRGLAEALDDYLAGRELAGAAVEVERIDDLPTIRRRMDEIIGGTRQEVLSIVTEFTDDAEAIDAARDEDMAVLERGITLRTIYPARIREMPISWAYAEETAAAGEQIRLVDEAPARLVIRDRDVAVVAADQRDPDAGALVIWSRPVIGTLVAMFELVWARATPAFSAAEGGRDVLRERRLLDLLAAGATDETAARQLGVSVRTVRRTTASLMDELGAASRFAAGAAAVRRGLV